MLLLMPSMPQLRHVGTFCSLCWQAWCPLAGKGLQGLDAVLCILWLHLKAASRPLPGCPAAARKRCLARFCAIGSSQDPEPLSVLLQTTDDKLADSYAALERKAELYERLKAGEAGFDDEERYNVDFLRKGFLEDDAAPSSGRRLPVVEDRHGSPRRGGKLGAPAGSA